MANRADYLKLFNKRYNQDIGSCRTGEKLEYYKYLITKKVKPISELSEEERKNIDKIYEGMWDEWVPESALKVDDEELKKYFMPDEDDDVPDLELAISKYVPQYYKYLVEKRKSQPIYEKPSRSLIIKRAKRKNNIFGKFGFETIIK